MLQRRLPGRCAETEGWLDIRDLAREKRCRHFRETLRTLGGEAETRVGRHRDVAAHRLRFAHFDPRQSPLRRAERLIALQSKLHNLTSRNGLRIDDAQFGFGRLFEVAEEIIAQAGRVESRHRVAARHVQEQLTERSFADIDLDFRINGQFGFAEVIGEDLRDRQLWQDLIGLDAKGEIRAGKTVGKALCAIRAEDCFGRFGFRKLLR